MNRMMPQQGFRWFQASQESNSDHGHSLDTRAICGRGCQIRPPLLEFQEIGHNAANSNETLAQDRSAELRRWVLLVEELN